MNNPSLKDTLTSVSNNMLPEPDYIPPQPDVELDDSDLEEISGGLASDMSCPSYEPE